MYLTEGGPCVCGLVCLAAVLLALEVWKLPCSVLISRPGLLTDSLPLLSPTLFFEC